MIQSVKDLGNILRHLYPDDFKDPVDIYIDHIVYTDIIFINLELSEENKCIYKNIDIKQNRPEIYPKLLFRYYTGRIMSYPSLIEKFDKKKVKRHFKDAFLGWFEREINDDLLHETDAKFLNNIYECLKSSEEKIIKELENITESYSFPKNSTQILTLKFLQDNEEKFLRDFKVFNQIFIKRIEEKYQTKWDITSVGENSVCTMCHKVKPFLYGCTSDIYSWFTLDKKSFAPFFDKEQAWKLFPICRECILDLEIGKKFIDKNLDLTFNQYCPYFLILKFIQPNLVNISLIKKLEQLKSISFYKPENNRKGTLEDYAEKEKAITRSAENQKGDQATPLTTLEIFRRESQLENFDKDKLIEMQKNTIKLLSNKEINSALSSNNILINFIFYSKSKSAIEILGTIEDILPSRISMIDEKTIIVKQMDVFGREHFPIGAVLGKLYPKIDGKANPKYISAVEAILKARKLNYRRIIRELSNASIEIMKDFYFSRGGSNKLEKQKQKSKFRSKNTYLINTFFQYLIFLKEIELITIKESEKMEKIGNDIINTQNITNDERVKKINSSFTKYKEFFYLPILKAVYILGVLSQFLLDIQYSQLDSTPFLNRLNGFRINKRIIVRLIPELQYKLREYKVRYTAFEELMGMYFLESGEDWEATDNELSFYFVLGMNNARIYKSKKEDDKNE